MLSVIINKQCIHPSIFCITYLHLGRGCAGACRRCPWARGSVHPELVARQLHYIQYIYLHFQLLRLLYLHTEIYLWLAHL